MTTLIDKTARPNSRQKQMGKLTETSSAAIALANRLAGKIEGEIFTDSFSRGRYATDASIYQIAPQAVVVPKTLEDLAHIIDAATTDGITLLPRGGGTSQSGQTTGHSLVVDFTKYLRKVVSVDPEASTCEVEPGIVLDHLNKQLAQYGLWYPIDVSTSSRCTIGGMTGNNSCGTRSLRYGIMRDRVLAIDAILADGTEARFDAQADRRNMPDAAKRIVDKVLQIGAENANHIASAFPEVSRRVGGYNIDAITPDNVPINLASLLCGSEGTLATSKKIMLKLAPTPKNKALGVCHFPTFRAAMDAAQHIVKLGPVAVEVVDDTLISLARDIPMFRAVMDRFVIGEPKALLLTEFAEDDQDENLRRLEQLDELMGDVGYPDSVFKTGDPSFQKEIWEVRKSGLNIMMSMKSEGKPVSFIEDCAVPLEHLGDYTDRLTKVFETHGTKPTWYAHASVGCLHVRPVLNLKLDADVKKMRAIAEEAFELVREYKGAHSGEHGDGLIRSEFHEPMYGRETIRIFEEIKDTFDPDGNMNPGKIVRPDRMDDRSLFRFKPDYAVEDFETGFDWSAWPGAAGGFQGAVEMCNNNGACRKFDAGVMCPSYRVTRNERDLVRGRANSLRLAISGQLGPDALTSDDMAETMKLCVGCKGCQRECPTSVDMAKMKTEVLYARNKTHGLSIGQRLVAHMPAYAPWATRLAALANLPGRIPVLAKLQERLTGFTARRALPEWTSNPFDMKYARGSGPEVALFADTFNTHFEPDNLAATRDVLVKLGYTVRPLTMSGKRLCCGRTYIASGMLDEAKAKAREFVDAVTPLLDENIPIVGIEPSCLLTLRDEFLALGLGKKAKQLADNALMLEEFLVREIDKGTLTRPLGKLADTTIHLHGHCHQKAAGIASGVADLLDHIDGVTVQPIETSCCGMAGSFGYGADTYETSIAMGELSLFPAVREAAPADIIAADGFSCRHQIADGTDRKPEHVAQILRRALSGQTN